MKKIFLWLAAGLAVFAAEAQQTEWMQGERSFLVFSTGLSVPVLCYASSNINKNTSGFAKPGSTFDVSYGYRFVQNFGITGSVFYSSNNTSKNIVQALGNDHYRYVGIMAGPLLTKKLFAKADGDIRFMTGIAHAWSPDLVYHNETILNKDCNTTFAWSASAGLLYSLTDKTFLSFKADHTQLKPKFHGQATGENVKNDQHIVVMNFDAGIGIKF